MAITIYRITTPAGEGFAGTAPDVVAAMRRTGLFTAGKTNREYMRFVAIQANRLNGFRLRTNNSATFLQDMIAAGMVKLHSTARIGRP